MSTTEIAWKKMYAQKKKRALDSALMPAPPRRAPKKKARKRPLKIVEKTKMITIIQRVEYQVQVEVSEEDIAEGMDANSIIDKYLKGMPNWYGGGETVYIDDNDDE